MRALALRDLLVANRIHGASVRIGVRREDGQLQAHAWVRWGELTLGDDPSYVRGFTEVDDLDVMRRG